MRIQDYKAAAAKLKEFSEFYEANRYKTWEEKRIELHARKIVEAIERMAWGGTAFIMPQVEPEWITIQVGY